MHVSTKRTIAICLTLFVFGTVFLTIPAQAVSNGVYLATAHPSYKHPNTGEIEDPGQNPGIGQGMTESATYKKALVEVDKDGSMYVTVRLQLMNCVNSVEFRVDGTPVSASVTQTATGEQSIDCTSDFRMKVNSENSVLRCNMYVAPMGRDVIFYITVSDLQPGSGNFKTTIEVDSPATEAPTDAPTEAPTDAPTEAPTEAPTDAPTEVPKEEPATAPTDGHKPTEPKATKPTESKTTKPTEPKKPAVTEPDKTKGTVPEETTAAVEDTTAENPTKVPETTEVMGLQEFNESGDQIQETKPGEEKSKGGHIGTFLMIILGVIVVGGAGFCIWYFKFFKKKVG